MEHEFAAFVFKLQAPVVPKVDNAMHWTNFYQTNSAYNSVVSLVIRWITI